MITVIWLSETQSIPKYGTAETGKTIDLPENIAKSFIERGMAELPTKKKPVKPADETAVNSGEAE